MFNSTVLLKRVRQLYLEISRTSYATESLCHLVLSATLNPIATKTRISTHCDFLAFKKVTTKNTLN